MTEPSKEACALHDDACEQNRQHYVDPETGYQVMTSVYLMTRSYCCGSGCRHCPWPTDVQQKAGRPDIPAYPYPATKS